MGLLLPFFITFLFNQQDQIFFSYSNLGFQVLVGFPFIVGILGKVSKAAVKLWGDKGSDFDVIIGHYTTLPEDIVCCFLRGKMEIDSVSFLLFGSCYFNYVKLFVFFSGKFQLKMEKFLGSYIEDTVIRDTFTFDIIKIRVNYRGEANYFSCLFNEYRAFWLR